jgi:undecaprenyl phosphate N,N'-diacetylbacillosamine 1-phosphate transferase
LLVAVFGFSRSGLRRPYLRRFAGVTMAERLRDIIVASVALVLLAPLMALIALAVRLSSPGPALFRQWRLGLNGRPFQLLKFRTMIHNAPDLRNPDGSAYTGVDDPRVTPLGRFLRATSLDELPQLINVLKGEMSLVGPRPDQVDQLRFYTEREKERLKVRPGLTGLAQISGRNRITWEQRKALDVEYVERKSFWLDLVILVRTVPYVLLRKDVHSHGRDWANLGAPEIG